MKAAVYNKYGPPEILQIQEVLRPKPNRDELLIKVHATTVNRTDCAFLRGKPFIARLFYGLFSPKNRILGSEFSGVIVEIGKNVTLFKPGDKVFGYNDTTFRAHAEYLILLEPS